VIGGNPGPRSSTPAFERIRAQSAAPDDYEAFRAPVHESLCEALDRLWPLGIVLGDAKEGGCLDVVRAEYVDARQRLLEVVECFWDAGRREGFPCQTGLPTLEGKLIEDLQRPRGSRGEMEPDGAEESSAQEIERIVPNGRCDIGELAQLAAVRVQTLLLLLIDI
jgi:hypothetical protein